MKNHPRSWFERFHLNSERAKNLLKEGGDTGYIWKKHEYMKQSYKESCPENAIVVLQMVICGDMEVLAECVYARDYNCNCGTKMDLEE